MKEQFVTYEIAKELKLLGFNEHCLAWYVDKDFYIMAPEHIELCLNSKTKNRYITAPLWQQVIDWFRVNHDLYLSTQLGNGDEPWYSYLITNVSNTSFIEDANQSWKTFEEAREQAILKAIEILKVKS